MNSREDYIENKTFDEIGIGDAASLTRKLTQRDIDLFAAMSGDVNPAHMDPKFAASDAFHKVIAHGMWGGALISAVLGTELPGPGTIYLDQSLHFRAPVALGDTVTVTVRARDKDENTHRITFDCKCTNQNGEIVIDGDALVIAPTEKIRRPRAEAPDVRVEKRGEKFRRMIERAEALDPVLTAVVHPVDANSLGGAVMAAQTNLITPILIGPEHKIRAVAEQAGLDISPFELIATPHSHAAAAEAVERARRGDVHALMKGSLHTDEFMHPIVASDSGLHTERRMSHVFLLDAPLYDRPLFITDGAINIAPDLEQKRDIVQNAIDMAKALGVDHPDVAILSAIEVVNPKIPSTVEAAALCKMADRGQITGGVVDGPLAFDNAVSKAAARAKGIRSPVAGHADILVVPDVEAGNMLAKQLEYLADADAAGVVVGARIPIILTSRSDSVQSRLASSAAAALLHHHKMRAAP